MTKYICTNSECKHRDCVLDVEDGVIVEDGVCQVYGVFLSTQWKVCDKLPDNWYNTQKPELPKLTAEIFDREDCPDWATCAFVEKDGNAFYSSAVHMAVSDKGECWGGSDFQDENLFLRIEGKWDATDWQNSLIKRSAKLPDWVEIGGYVYCPRNGYGKIIRGSVKSCYIEFDGGAGDFSAEGIAQLFLPARLRPYNAEEMKALVGKVIESKNKVDCLLVTAYNSGKELDDVAAVMILGEWVTAEELLICGYTLIDGHPCGAFEYLENGEWVK